MLKLENFRKEIDPTILRRGRDYFNSKRVTKITQNKDGRYEATVKGTKNYKVYVRIDENENITFTDCTCPYNYGQYCKHVAAVLYTIDSMTDKSKPGPSSPQISYLVRTYENALKNQCGSDTEGAEMNLRAELFAGYDHTLEFALKIGTDKMYKVRSIPQLFEAFQREDSISYGKKLTFTHRIEALDERSRDLLKLAAACFGERPYYGRPDKVDIGNISFETFFELHRDSYLEFEGNRCFVKYEDPKIVFSLVGDKRNRYKLTADKSARPLGRRCHSCFYDEAGRALLLASPEFTNVVYELYRILFENNVLYISEREMPEFYTAVLKNISRYSEIQGIELAEKYAPPEMIPQLYVDSSEDGTVYASLMFNYGEQTFLAYANNDCPHYDKIGEELAKSDVQKYFFINPRNDHHPLMISGDDMTYNFIVNGLNELSKTMELYISDKFRRMTVRPPIRPRLGVRPSGNLLELDISDDNYSAKELVEILNAYRMGAKYHRFKDGSFAIIENYLAEFNGFTENLNISSKDINNGKLKIPTYRMLYLDSLQSCKSFHTDYSEEFKKIVGDYRTEIGNTDKTSVPSSLAGIMRDYQKYGFCWMKTISAYKFGGILADDMGLGKTIQAISLMLDEKKRSEKHVTNLIVCPSSLVLNWENEILKFAPQLKTVSVIGAAAARDRLFGKILSEEYDAVITSYTLLSKDIEKYENLIFRLHFIDEAQYIKNHNTQAARAVKSVRSEIRFALTGTPIENSLAELWSVFDFIMPDFLFGYIYFKKTYEVPIVTEKNEEAIKNLQNSVAPFILRRLKKDVLNELPDKTETVLISDMEGKQRKLYTAAAAMLRKCVDNGFGGNQMEHIKILAMLTRLRQICCDPHLVYENYTDKSAKLEQCIELVESCVDSGHKILLFSQFTSMLDIISRRLQEINISFYMLKGSTNPKDRIRMVNDFNKNDVKVFLISLKAGGTGLNLTGADIVIHYDPWWNVSAENQASDRAYRIGQKNNVQVYKLIARNSIEENILKLQKNKSDLSDIIYGENIDITKMSAEEILKILE